MFKGFNHKVLLLVLISTGYMNHLGESNCESI